MYLTNVVKKKGNKEPFSPDKIKGSLQKAVIDAGFTLEEKNSIINEVFININKKLDNEEEIPTKTIRMCLLSELDECEPYIAKSVRRFDCKYKQG